MWSFTLPRKLSLAVAIILTLAPLVVIARSANPPDARTGAPGEGLCTQCHNSFPANSGNGTLVITGTPIEYSDGVTYTVTVTLEDPGQQQWGYELTAVTEGGEGAGSFTITDLINTQLSDNAAPGRDYVKQTLTGTYDGIADGPVSWNVDWTAPSIDAGIVTFYASGNAADGNGNSSGDYVYTASAISDPEPAPFVCGDPNADGDINIGDGVYIINYVFKGGPAPQPLESGDATCDGNVNVGDGVYIVNFIFSGGPAPCTNCP